MNKAINIFLADASMLILEGLKNVFAQQKDLQVAGEALNPQAMRASFAKERIDVLLIDYTSGEFTHKDVLEVLEKHPDCSVVGISDRCEVDELKELLEHGIHGHLMNDCDREEILDSVRSTHNGDRFFCGKVLNRINESEGEESELDCEPILISEREVEILRLIATGLTAKQIGEKLHLSFHTVVTHRKNMMAKLGIKNTAGLIIYAVKENLISPNKFLFS
ncbi:MAG: response regulator transcription factor [Flavobacteriales bacterium]|jgi:DNA-binding NarL/FixJ family response regulator|nr:response regulator transcription factor [Flavobacteriales bacterium]NCG29368.1 response regulator [Bacteroidota bacterium]MBT3963796.1 response regulator transcription factor [Flavobacteriales bacterium]MBT4705423.1 response regulator transcription factor [Flavobacteriales bacterium]MBT4929826.1 response regulator transcription factor [Flavobacteriales bacterium]